MTSSPPSKRSTLDDAAEKGDGCSVEPSSPDLRSDISSTKESYYEVTLEPEDDPQNLPRYRKWLAVITISTSSIVSTCASSAAAFTEQPVANDLGVSKEVAILGISLYVLGLGLGPLLAGPCSEVFGRAIVYRVAFVIFFALCWPVAFAPNIVVYFVFRFFTGFAAAAFLSVAGGSVSDMFTNDTVATPMAVFTISPFLGPGLGPLYSGFVNQHLNWRWTYHIITIWTFIQTIALFLLVPESYRPVLERRKAARVRKETGIDSYYAPSERTGKTFGQLLSQSCTTPFLLLLFEPMALLIDLWNSLVLGILYLAFQAFPIIFSEGHGFSTQFTGMTFLGIVIGMLAGLATQPYWNGRFRKYKKAHGDPPPEFRLIMGEVGGILVTAGLFWLAFTTYPFVHWIVPIIASVPFGAGVYFVYTSSFTYLVVAYRPVAASAMAANSAMRSSFAAAFPLFATAMYHTLGTVGATALLAGLTAIMTPLPFIFHRYGERLRRRSRFAAA